MTPNEVKAYTLIDWISMVPGTIIGGLAMTPRGVGLGSGWSLDTVQFPVWKRNCLAEHLVNLREHLPVTMISRTGVSVYCTSNSYLNEVLIDFNKDDSKRKVNVQVDLSHGEIVGIFLGNILRVEGQTFVNFLTLDGKDLWLCVACGFTSQPV